MAEIDASDARQIVDRRWSAWMASAQGGDRAAYEALLRECVPLVQRVARGQGVRGPQVDDVVQDVLLTLHRARQTYDPAQSFTAWLRTIAKRRAIPATVIEVNLARTEASANADIGLYGPSGAVLPKLVERLG